MKKKRSSFKNKVRRDAERQKSASSNYGYLILPNGVSVFSPEPGSRVKLDIIPYEVTDANHPDKYEDEQIATVGELWYKRPFRIHRNIGTANDAVVCPRSFGKPCPICEYREKLLKEGADKEETNALRPSQRNLYVVIPQGVKGMEEKPHIWDMSQYLFQNLLNTELEEDEDNGVFPDLEDGKTLKIRFDSSQIAGGRAFAEASRIDFATRRKPYDESILDIIPKLDEVLKVLSYKELEAKFLELDPDDIDDHDAKPIKPVATVTDDDDDDDWEDESPKPRKKASKAKPAPEPEEDDDDWDDEKEETPPPPPKKKRKPEPAPEEDNEEEEEPWEDDDNYEPDEPAPPKKTSKTAPVKKKRKPEPEPEPDDDDDDDWDDDWDED